MESVVNSQSGDDVSIKAEEAQYPPLIKFFYGYYDDKKTINRSSLIPLKSLKNIFSPVEIEKILNLIQADVLLDRTTKLLLKVIEINDERIFSLFKNIFINVFLKYKFTFCDIRLTDKFLSLKDDLVGELIRGLLKNHDKSINDNMQSKYKNNLIIIFLSLLYLHYKDFGIIYTVYKKYICNYIEYKKKIVIFLQNIMDPNLKKITDMNFEDIRKYKGIIENNAKEIDAIKAENMSSELEIGDLKKRLYAKQSEAVTLSNKIIELNERIKIREIDFLNTLADLKGNIIRDLTVSVELLQNGLSALQSNNPKPNVTLDHGERVIESLSKCIEYIRGN